MSSSSPASPGLTAARITRAFRVYAPVPVRLSTAARGGDFIVTIAKATAIHAGLDRQDGRDRLSSWLSRQLGTEIHIAAATIPERGWIARLAVRPGHCGPDCPPAPRLTGR